MNDMGLSHLVERALRRGRGELVFDVDVEEFLRHHFERRPVTAPARAGISLTWDEFFADLPSCHEAGTVRYLTPETPAVGMPREEVNAILNDLGGTTPEAFRQYFAEAPVTFAVQGGVRYWESIRRPAESLAERLGTHVSVTVMATPAHTAGTSLHYDSSDVFAVQLQGSKRWAVFEPQDPWPCSRTPQRQLNREEGALVPRGSFDLGEGDVLYVPRGWLHDVRNAGDQPSLHASFVVHPNTWLSLFANLIDQGFDALRDRLEWRESLSATDSDPREALAVLDRFVAELRGEMAQRLVAHGWAGFDHVVNDAPNRELREGARRSLESCEDSNGVRVVRTGAHYLLRHSNEGDFVRVSGDGSRFHDVPARLFERVSAAEDGVSLAELEQDSFSEDEIVNGLHALVHESGAFRLVSSAGAGARSGA